ncbi:MAG TPA: PD-(D/E)XK nuclease family protein [Acidimicrobiales bacterium]|nr:PD-(D/E)XK nuclease family protein [Acidimicrobiales bacterium]
MELSESQLGVVEHAGGPLVVTGGFGAGKTTALVHRWRRLAAEHGSGRIAFVVRNAAAVEDVRRRMLGVIAATGKGAVGPLVVTTFAGLALDIVRRHGGRPDVHLIAGEDQRSLVAALLRHDAAAPATWPTQASFVGRDAFVPEVADAVLAYQAAFVGPDELRGVGHRWEELAAFANRYSAALAERDGLDVAGVLVAASMLLRDSEVVATVRARFVEFIVDDFEVATFATHRLLAQLAGENRAVTIAGNPGAAIGENNGTNADYFERAAAEFDATCLTVERAAPDRAPERLVVCRHPSVEADAVAGELERARHERDLRWSDLAVVTRRGGAPVRAIVRALNRRGIPVAAAPAPLATEPIVTVLRARLLTADAATSAADALDQAVEAVADGLIDDPAGPVDPAAERALDALVAFATAANDWLAKHPKASAGELAAAFDAEADDAEPSPLGGVSMRAASVDGVTVATVEQAAGRSWDTVVVSACVEGQFPRVDGRTRFFDPYVLGGPEVPDAAERRRRSLAEERRRFALACTRATRTAIYVAAPQPGVLVSRYVDHLDAHDPDMAWPAPVAREHRARTGSARPMHPTGALRLSASQLDTYEDCPRRWFYDNHLRLSDRSSVWAGFGTLVHDVLEEFLRPRSAHPFTLDYLLELGDRMWRDDVATWAPQREQARRELDQVLEKWWQIEGADFDRSQVLSVEHAFEVPVGVHTVRGRIDRIDHDPSGTGIAVVDYKTSTRAISDAEAVDDLQLAVYHLAATRDAELAEVGSPVRLELLYLRSGKHREQAITGDHEERTEARILVAAQAILDEAIDPNPAAECGYCDYHRLCPLQKAGRDRGAP